MQYDNYLCRKGQVHSDQKSEYFRNCLLERRAAIGLVKKVEEIFLISYTGDDEYRANFSTSIQATFFALFCTVALTSSEHIQCKKYLPREEICPCRPSTIQLQHVLRWGERQPEDLSRKWNETPWLLFSRDYGYRANFRTPAVLRYPSPILGRTQIYLPAARCLI